MRLLIIFRSPYRLVSRALYSDSSVSEPLVVIQIFNAIWRGVVGRITLFVNLHLYKNHSDGTINRGLFWPNMHSIWHGIKISWHSTKGGSVLVGVEKVSVTDNQLAGELNSALFG